MGEAFFIYVREDIPNRILSKYELPQEIEGMFIELRFQKQKWLVFGGYKSPSQRKTLFLNSLQRGLDIYSCDYDNFLLLGDFNMEETESCFQDFCDVCELSNLVREPTYL